MRLFIWFLMIVSYQSLAVTKAAYRVSKLANGLDVVMMEDHKVPLITIVLSVKAGAFTETQDINGLTHLWEHMFFKGNKRIPDQEAFNRRIRQLGIVYNGDTSAEKVRYYFTMPSVFLEDGLQFMADAITTPLLDKVELEKERQVVLDEYDRNASQPGFDLYRLRRKIIYGQLGFLRDPLGERSIIERATREQLFRIKDEVFVPANSSLLVAGDFTEIAIMPLVKKYFESWKNPRDWKPMTSKTFQKFPETTDIVITRPMAQNANIMVVYQGPKARAEQHDSYCADVLISLLELTTGKFFKKFIDSGQTLGAGLSYQTQSQAGELWVVATTEPQKAIESKDLLLKEIPLWIKPDYFSATQLQDVRRQLVIAHKKELNKPSEYVKTLAFWWPITGLDYYDSYLENLQKIKLSDISAFVKKYFIGKDYISSILLSPQSAKTVGLKDNTADIMKKHNIKAL